MEVSVSRKPLEDEGGKIKGQTDTRKATPKTPNTRLKCIKAFPIVESPSVASDMKACSHTQVGQDMERVTHTCTTAKGLTESNRFSPIIPA